MTDPKHYLRELCLRDANERKLMAAVFGLLGEAKEAEEREQLANIRKDGELSKFTDQSIPR